ncbi:MAG TPA: hypothetical protein DGG95_11920, partial [Cytophagales bacterium]|nr:hypothetical protein [Cytophagales bacterium]
MALFNRRSFIIVPLLLAASFVLYAQQSLTDASLLTQSSFTQWTGDNGLVSNNITSAIRDRNGFVWITSYNGIMRFDGVQVYVFDQTKIPFLVSGAFYSVYEDKEGTLWFSSQNSGIVLYKSGKFERLDPEGKILPKSIRCLQLAEDGTVWVGSNNFGLFKIQNNEITKIESPELSKVSILDIKIDANGNLWIATDGKGVFKYDGKRFKNLANLTSRVVNSIAVASDNTLFFGTPDGLDVLKNDKVTRSNILKDFQINKIICDRYNRVWFGTELGLGRFTLNDESSFEYVTEKEGFPLSRIAFLFYDSENSLWVSTGRDGLFQIRESNIVNITRQQGLSVDKINMIAEDHNHVFYVGSDGGGIDVYSDGRVTPLKINTPIFNSGIRDIYIHPKNTLWIGSYRGLLRKDKNSERLYDLKDGLTAVDIRRIIPADGDNLWIATRSGGIMKFGNGKVLEKYGLGTGLESNYVLALENDSLGNLHVGTHSGGMTILHRDGKSETFHIEANDDGVLIFNIHFDKRGKIWAVGNTGLFHFTGKKFIKLNLTKSLVGEIFFDWVEDRNGNVWVTSNLGVLKIFKSDVLKFVSGEIKEVPFKLFDNRDGMKGKECTAATRSLLSLNGKIWVPTLNGIAVFYPDKIKENKIPPPVYITSLKADDKEFNASEKIVIEPGKLRYTFNFTSPSFISPRKIRFKYKLEGVDGSWIEAGTVRQAEYTNLTPRDYVFHVQACNSDGVWNEQGARIHFEVKPFFYQTSYFYILITVLFAVLLYLAYKWRVNSIERRNRELRKVNGELDRFVYSASHDLRAPLASILGLVNVARLDKGNNFENYLDKIEKSVTKLDGFIRDIIDFSRNARTEVEAELIDFKTL